MRSARISASLASAMLAITFSSSVAAVDLKPKLFPLTILGVKVGIPVTVSFDANTAGDALDLQVRAQASLKDAQDNALTIANAIPMPRGNCDHDGVNPVVNSIDAASIAPVGATAVITISGHVTAWVCKHLLGTPAKTIVGSDSVTLTATVQIVVIDQKEIGLQLTGPVSVATGHALTAEVANLLAVDTDASITSQLAKALDASEARASLPDMAGLTVNIQSAQFAAENSHLLVRAVATAHMSGDAFSSLLELMNK